MSHGQMAAGMLNSAKLFFGDDIAQIEALCLKAEDNPEQFDERIKEAVKKVDDGHGVIAMCDLLGGTPSNRSAYVVSDRVKVITGMNFTMLLELLGKRLSVEDLKDLDLEELMNVGRDGIKCLNDLLKG